MEQVLWSTPWIIGLMMCQVEGRVGTAGEWGTGPDHGGLECQGMGFSSAHTTQTPDAHPRHRNKAGLEHSRVLLDVQDVPSKYESRLAETSELVLSLSSPSLLLLSQNLQRPSLSTLPPPWQTLQRIGNRHSKFHPGASQGPHQRTLKATHPPQTRCSGVWLEFPFAAPAGVGLGMRKSRDSRLSFRGAHLSPGCAGIH